MTDKSEKSAKDYLRPEDRILWETVAKTTKPLSGKKPKEEEFPDFKIVMAQAAEKMPAKKPPSSAADTPTPKKKFNSLNEMPIHTFDRPTHRKISKGRVDIEARIDLHGLTQNDAYELLYGFLLSAHARGLKHVMVITGKGRSFGSEGVLKQAVPHWFSTPLFRLLVSAYEDAANHHGGHGALYVRLRRQTQGGGLIR
ncbi:Smr/MutS family protein [Ochrobactrum sp. Marseille-Q0166]|uniref:Smr/MutS family protein n=1 Tax=Ochrobactrum sp. Marseille-Q0166 TaxID=2761105 RepID=UPI001655190E|nr:Smr/MutS family protein [Ochrobactrum sp. Marseille-Q0166]MBC8716355.1 Smr/MutS family protein [Ochrobactrum sp. Marseille-Q0166]